MLNIGGDANDRSYRYKMSPLVTKIEGRGNGIKTVLVNMADVAKQLHIDAAYPTKFFGIELGAQTKWNEEKERAVVNGAHQNKDMQAILGRFIEQFILCPTCRLPEINMKIKKKGIKVDCAACGNNSVLSGGHKLITYILKHYEKKKKERDGGKDGKRGKKDKKKKKDKRRDNEEKTPVEQKSSKPAKKSKEKTTEDVWHADTSIEAQQRRKVAEIEKMDHSNEAVTQILREAALENKENSPSTILKIFLAQKERTSREIVSEVRRLQLARALDDPKAIKVLLESVLDFDDIKGIPKQFAKHSELFAHFTNRNAIVFLGCVEELVGVIEPRLLARTPIILKELFDAEVLSEESIISWFEMDAENSWLVNKRVADQVRAKATPFVEWLRAVDSEESGEDSSDEEA